MSAHAHYRTPSWYRDFHKKVSTSSWSSSSSSARKRTVSGGSRHSDAAILIDTDTADNIVFYEGKSWGIWLPCVGYFVFTFCWVILRSCTAILAAVLHLFHRFCNYLGTFSTAIQVRNMMA